MRPTKCLKKEGLLVHVASNKTIHYLYTLTYILYIQEAIRRLFTHFCQVLGQSNRHQTDAISSFFLCARVIFYDCTNTLSS